MSKMTLITKFTFISTWIFAKNSFIISLSHWELTWEIWMSRWLKVNIFFILTFIFKSFFQFFFTMSEMTILTTSTLFMLFPIFTHGSLISSIWYWIILLKHLFTLISNNDFFNIILDSFFSLFCFYFDEKKI